MPSRTIALLDADAFFAECERVSNPRLIGRPILVVADAKRRSVVLTSSYEARAFGVRTGMVLYEARRLCPQAVVVEGHTPLYLRFSSEIEKILNEFSDRVEMSSVDEAYLDLTEVLEYFRTSAVEIACRIQSRVKSELGLPVTVGIGPNKLIAKLLADLAKPAGVRAIEAADVPALLEQTPVKKLCGIGSRMERALAPFGVRTAADLGRVPLDSLTARFGVIGWTLQRMGLGLDDSAVLPPSEWDPVKSVGHAHTLPRDTSSAELIESYLLLLSEKVAARLRRYGFSGRVIHTTIRTSEFQTLGRQRRVAVALSGGREIFAVAKNILAGIWSSSGEPLRLVGVSISELTPRAAQPSLIAEHRRRAALDDVMDAVNRRYGRWTVRPAAQIPAERFGVLPTPIPPKKNMGRLPFGG